MLKFGLQVLPFRTKVGKDTLQKLERNTFQHTSIHPEISGSRGAASQDEHSKRQALRYFLKFRFYAFCPGVSAPELHFPIPNCRIEFSILFDDETLQCSLDILP